MKIIAVIVLLCSSSRTITWTLEMLPITYVTLRSSMQLRQTQAGEDIVEHNSDRFWVR